MNMSEAKNGQTVSWLGFCASSNVTKTIVHFYPSSGAVSAPYGVTFELSVFGRGIKPQHVAMEGARLSQPDGVVVDDVFESLASGGADFYGLRIDVISLQPRVDITSSACVIEFVSPGSSVKYTPIAISAANEDQPAVVQGGLALADGITQTSVVIVNSSDEASVPSIVDMRGMPLDLESPEDQLENPVEVRGQVEQGTSPESTSASESLPPSKLVGARSVREIKLNGNLYGDSSAVECSWGAVAAEGLYVTEKQPHLAYFSVFRDAATKRPVSVCAL